MMKRQGLSIEKPWKEMKKWGEMGQSFSYSYRDQHALPPLELGLDPLLPLTRHQHTCLYNYNKCKETKSKWHTLYMILYISLILLTYFFQFMYYILHL